VIASFLATQQGEAVGERSEPTTPLPPFFKGDEVVGERSEHFQMRYQLATANGTTMMNLLVVRRFIAVYGNIS
jgi:hypothetical protein